MQVYGTAVNILAPFQITMISKIQSRLFERIIKILSLSRGVNLTSLADGVLSRMVCCWLAKCTRRCDEVHDLSTSLIVNSSLLPVHGDAFIIAHIIWIYSQQWVTDQVSCLVNRREIFMNLTGPNSSSTWDFVCIFPQTSKQASTLWSLLELVGWVSWDTYSL